MFTDTFAQIFSVFWQNKWYDLVFTDKGVKSLVFTDKTHKNLVFTDKQVPPSPPSFMVMANNIIYPNTVLSLIYLIKHFLLKNYKKTSNSNISAMENDRN